MVNPARLITQIAIVGSQILGRAFVDAYKQAAKNAAQNAAGGTGRAALDATTRKTGISVEEAAQILNVEKTATTEEILKSYEHLFKVNNPKEGGSFYLQSKVYRAKERLDMELKRRMEAEAEKAGPTPPPS
ncbi:mitochondrial import inner membrane translocase subunit TIM16 [Geranomyces michiganensis]|nr:mitochondrial import inner membrane translocase subunit TIM16 [Geranomyces michiganensis]